MLEIVVNDYYETNIPGYYAIGDVVADSPCPCCFSRRNYMCRKNSGQNPEPIDYNNIPGCTYCSPEKAQLV